MNSTSLSRRTFTKTVALAGAAMASGLTAVAQEAAKPRHRNIKLGLDNYSVRNMNWKAGELIDYAAKLGTDSLFITDFGPFESFEEKYLNEIRLKAQDKGIQIQLGSWSICPTSRSFRNDWGTADEHLALGIRMAKALGSPVFRVIQGTSADRATPGGIEARIADTVTVLKAGRSRAIDAGVKVAVENHAGDMQAWELVTLIEAAGKEFVGANMDSGNAVNTFEDPEASLEILAPYVVTTSLRDSAIWESANGATTFWAAMGDGTLDLKAYFDKFETLCPGVPVHIETISGGAREIAYLRPGFWTNWPKARAKDFARFLALAKKGQPKVPAARGAMTQQEFQRDQLERSIRYCKEVLGLGPRSP